MGRIGSHHLRAFLAVAATLVSTIVSSAHPHVLPIVQIAIFFDRDESARALQYTWTYDAAYSGFSIRDIDVNKDSILSENELATFAKNQVSSFAEHSYFTSVTTQGGKIEFDQLESFSAAKLGDGRLELKFFISLKPREKPNNQIVVEIYDPNFFAYFTMADHGVQLIGAREGCVPIVAGPQPVDLRNTKSVPAMFWQALDGSKAAGLEFVNRITVKCP